MKFLLGGLVLVEQILTISSNQDAGYDIFTAAGSPANPSLFIVTVNSTIRVAAMTSSACPTGSRIRIINNGCIYGLGGAGGAGGDAGAGVTPGATGTAGGAALTLPTGLDMAEIDNTNGYILGGGDGGRGGDSFYHPLDYEAGGGGGGGAGGPKGTGGTQGTAYAGSASYLPHWGGFYWNQGFPGQFMEWGDGGVGGQSFYGNGANGSNGGSYGVNGKAVTLNGVPLTWLGGNNGTQVKGAVS